MGPDGAARRPLVVYGDGPDAPLPDPASLEAVARLTDPEVLLGWTVRPAPWVDTTPLPVSTTLTGAGLRRSVVAGRVRPLHTRLSAMPALLAGRLRPAVAVVGAVERRGRWHSIGSVGWAPAAAAAADAVVIERWPSWPAGHGDLPPCPAIEGNIVEVVDRTDPPDPPQPVVATDLEAAIGAAVAALVPEGATLQWGPGSIGAAVVAALARPVRVRSGLVTDELAALAGRGLLDGPAEAAYAWGGPGLADLVSGGRVRLLPVELTHDASRLSAIPRLVTVNTALEIGLDGAVNVESAGGRIVSGPGGHPDFCLAGSRSVGGLSVIAARSSVAGRSVVVERPATVSTPRSDVDVVVTEHGVADLRGLDDRARAVALIAVAAPEHRDALAAAAERAGDRRP